MVAKHVNKKNAGKPRVLAIIKPSVQWLSIVNSYNDAKPPSVFCANWMYYESDPGQAGYSALKRLHGKI